ncbi:FMN-dependent NADH-azoreductase 2 [compost metagenome]
MESGHRYISIIMAFFGIPETQGLFVEGHNQFPDKAQQIKADAISKAQELAKSF